MGIIQTCRNPILRPSYSASGGGGGGSFAANRPSGLTTIIDRQWNPTDGVISGGVLPPASLSGTDSHDMQWFQASNVAPLIDTPANLTSVIGESVPALPDGNATCMCIRYPSGFDSGAVPFGIFKNTVALSSRMYIACWLFVPVAFNSNGNNIKFVFFAQNNTGTSTGRNHVAMWLSGTQGNEVGNWIANQGGGGNLYMGGTASDAPGPIVDLQDANIPALKGSWVCGEWYMQQESSPGSNADGQGIFWMNGQKRGEWNNIRYNAPGDSAKFDASTLSVYYGGGGGNAPSNQYLLMGRYLVARAA